MHLLGITFILYLLKLSAGNGFMEAFSTGLLELLSDYQGLLEIVQLTIGKRFGVHEFLCGGPFPNCDVTDFMILTTVVSVGSLAK